MAWPEPASARCSWPSPFPRPSVWVGIGTRSHSVIASRSGLRSRLGSGLKEVFVFESKSENRDKSYDQGEGHVRDYSDGEGQNGIEISAVGKNRAEREGPAVVNAIGTVRIAVTMTIAFTTTIKNV